MAIQTCYFFVESILIPATPQMKGLTVIKSPRFPHQIPLIISAPQGGKP
jgi:hypothetical protein